MARRYDLKCASSQGRIHAVLPIGAVARQTGLRASAIRYYERLGLLPAPDRVGGRRRYRTDVLTRLAVIRFARASGFTLREVRRLLGGRPYSSGLRRLARAKISELGEVIARARTMQALLERGLRCRCLTAEECGRVLGPAVLPPAARALAAPRESARIRP
jgi:MerR family transcriptional regulator, redox-sensitive transcriptional activator SoxR